MFQKAMQISFNQVNDDKITGYGNETQSAGVTPLWVRLITVPPLGLLEILRTSFWVFIRLGFPINWGAHIGGLSV